MFATLRHHGATLPGSSIDPSCAMWAQAAVPPVEFEIATISHQLHKPNPHTPCKNCTTNQTELII